MGESIHIDWGSMITAVPAFLTIVIQPFTFSIANGIYAGLVMSVLLYILTGRFFDCCRGDREETEYDKDEFADDMGMEARLLDADGINGAGLNGHTQPTRAPWEVPAAQPSVAAVPIATGSFRRQSSTLSASQRDSHHMISGSQGSYQRGSFSMYINTFGSQPSPRAILRQHGDSEDPEHQ